MHVLVTGCAGFIGSHTTDRLLSEGHDVRGVDCFTEYYDPELKRSNLTAALTSTSFEFIDADLVTADPRALLEGVDSVMHLAGQPGVRDSWSDGFEAYVQRNIIATQRLLEAARTADISRFVAASCSSIYGDAETYPTTESAIPLPVSPYGVTKLAAENLCTLYATNFDVPTISLRYFTVYGPRQRPDMAMRRMIDLALAGEAFPLYGDGSVSRSFTYVDDVVDANLAALVEPVRAGTVCNIADQTTWSMTEVIDLVGEALGHPVELDRQPAADGDARRTGGSSRLALETIRWSPSTTLPVGISTTVDWCRGQLT